MNDPNYCGPLAYRFTNYDNMLETIPWMFHDESTMEIWMDIQPLYEDLVPDDRSPTLILEVTLADWPDVTPVFQIIQPTILCPTQHSSWEIYGTPKQTSIEYDVTDATAQLYCLHNLKVYPVDCFQSAQVEILDANGVAPSFAQYTRTTLSLDVAYDSNKL